MSELLVLAAASASSRSAAIITREPAHDASRFLSTSRYLLWLSTRRVGAEESSHSDALRMFWGALAMSACEWARGALDTLGYPRAATFELEQEHLIHASTWIEDRKVRDDSRLS